MDEAEHDLNRTRVESPISGFVTNLLTRQGDYARAGTPLVALVDSDSFLYGLATVSSEKII
ncbi:p-hydroxybenzoic acid efflux subunit AaeA [compost metagenome]